MKSRYRLAAASTYSSGLSCGSFIITPARTHTHNRTRTTHAHECKQHAQLAVVLVKKKKKKTKGGDDEELCHVTWKWSRQVS